MAASKPNRKCSCGCGRPARYQCRLEEDGAVFYVGTFATKAERSAAREAKRLELAESSTALTTLRSCESVVTEYLAECAEKPDYKDSSLDTATRSLAPFRRQFGGRPIGEVTRQEAKLWARSIPKSYVPNVVSLFNWAVDEGIIGTNPFRGLGHRGKGRADLDPPTLKEIETLRSACSALGGYGRRMRDFIDFAALSLMRPSEIYALEWDDINFAEGEIRKERRLYRGKLDTPKSGPVTIPLPTPAEEILLRQPTRTRADGLVFVSKTGKRLSSPTFSQYWALVQARAGRDRLDPRTDPYFVTKHYGVHLLAKEGLSARAIAAQAGWEESTAEAMMRVYGHLKQAGYEEMQAHWQAKRRAEADAQPTQPAPYPAP